MGGVTKGGGKDRGPPAPLHLTHLLTIQCAIQTTEEKLWEVREEAVGAV